MQAYRSNGPSLVNSVLEFRAGLEACSLPGAYPLLMMAARGDGQPVLLVPGFTSSDNATFFVRRYLRKLGYDVHGWGQGPNIGLSASVLEALEERLLRIARESGRPVSLVGWSLGGFYVRALANRHPDKVRSIITIATAFALPTPRAINRVITRLYGYLNPMQQSDELFVGSDVWESNPPMPSTSVYSEGDGVNNWRYCLDEEGPRSENVRVFGSHCGLTLNPMVYYVLADRLAQDPLAWAPYCLETSLAGIRGRLAADVRENLGQFIHRFDRLGGRKS